MLRRIAVAAVAAVALVPTAHAADRSPLWSPDGRRIAYLSGRDLVVMRADGNRRRFISRRVRAFSWSRDGRRLLFRAGDAVWTASADGTRSWFVALSVHDPVWAPDGGRVAYVAYVDGDATLMTAARDGSDRREVYSADGGCIDDPVLLTAPSTRWIAFSCVVESFYPFGYSGAIAVVDVGAETGMRFDAVGLPLSWSPDGEQLAVRALEPTSDPSEFEWAVEIFDARSAGFRILGSFSDAVFAPDWKYAAVFTDAGGRIVDVATGRRTAAGSLSAAAWSSRGSLALVRGGAIWRAREDGLGAARLRAGGAPAWSPDGRTIVFVRSGHIWRMRADGAHVRRLT